jgi:hypothetical protein
LFWKVGKRATDDAQAEPALQLNAAMQCNKRADARNFPSTFDLFRRRIVCVFRRQEVIGRHRPPVFPALFAPQLPARKQQSSLSVVATAALSKRKPTSTAP